MEKNFQLLMVEDNESYYHALESAIKRCNLPLLLDHVEDGDALLPYLKKGKKPHLILMDINMDRVSGLQALRLVKKEPRVQAHSCGDANNFGPSARRTRGLPKLCQCLYP